MRISTPRKPFAACTDRVHCPQQPGVQYEEIDLHHGRSCISIPDFCCAGTGAILRRGAPIGVERCGPADALERPSNGSSHIRPGVLPEVQSRAGPFDGCRRDQAMDKQWSQSLSEGVVLFFGGRLFEAIRGSRIAVRNTPALAIPPSGTLSLTVSIEAGSEHSIAIRWYSTSTTTLTPQTTRI